MAKIQTLPAPQEKAKKKAILPHGKHEDAILKPRWDNEIAIRELADELLKDYAESQALWLQDFFIPRLITRKQIMQMRNRSEYFAEVYSICKDIQESRLFKAGLTGAGNLQLTIFALKNVSLWRNEPKEDTEATQPLEIILKPRQLAAGDNIPEAVAFEFKLLEDENNQESNTGDNEQ